VRVEVEGLEGEARTNALAYLSIYQERESADLAEPRLQELHRRAPQEIGRALEPFGHYQAQVQASLGAGEGGWAARYVVQPGPPVALAEVEVQVLGPGAGDPDLAARARGFPLRPGDPLVHARYEQGKKALLETALERGYLDARFVEQTVQVELEPYRASLRLHLDSGPRYRFGAVRFETTGLDEELLRRYLPFQPGQPYRASALLELQRALTDSDYFELVEVFPEREAAAEGAVPIRVRATARKSSRYRVGLGYGTDTGARAGLDWERRRVNRRGHRAEARLRAAQRESRVDARYLIPLEKPGSELLAFSAELSQEETASSDTQTVRVGVARTRQRGVWKRTVALDYEDADFEVGSEKGHARLLMPGAEWTRLSQDDPFYPSRGHRLTLRLRGAADGVLSDTGFLRAHLQGKWVLPAVQSDRLILRGELGALSAGDFDRLPPAQRFFAGGDNSVRGYDLDELGPKDDTGQVVGGHFLTVASVEYERQLGGKWSGAVFYDAGNAWNGAGDGLRQATGVGLRWRSPIGPVRVDLGMAVDEPGNPVRLHLVVGPDL
jgi:translocation and assembly module TamA